MLLDQSQQQQEAYDTIREDNNLEQPLLGNKGENNKHSLVNIL